MVSRLSTAFERDAYARDKIRSAGAWGGQGDGDVMGWNAARLLALKMWDVGGRLHQ